jgi:hypothetical protein
MRQDHCPSNVVEHHPLLPIEEALSSSVQWRWRGRHLGAAPQRLPHHRNGGTTSLVATRRAQHVARCHLSMDRERERPARGT